MEESLRYSTLRSTSTKPNTATRSQTNKKSPLSTLETFSKNFVSDIQNSVNTLSKSVGINNTEKLPTTKLPTVKSETANIQSTINSNSANIETSVKGLKTQADDSFKSIEKTVTPYVNSVTEPVIKTVDSINVSVEKSVKKTVQTIQNSPITKRFLGLFILPFEKHGSSILSLMIIIFGILLIYKELNKNTPVKTGEKNVIGKIVYETFKKPKYSGFEGFSLLSIGKDIADDTNKFKKETNKIKKSYKKEEKKNKKKDNCPELNKDTVKNFCDRYDNDKVSDTCLENRCRDLKGNCKKSKCCEDKKLCENFTLMGKSNLNINSDFDFYKKRN